MMRGREAEGWGPWCDLGCAEWSRGREVAVKRPRLCWSYCDGPHKRWRAESQRKPSYESCVSNGITCWDGRQEAKGKRSHSRQGPVCPLHVFRTGAEISSQGARGVRTGTGKCLELPFLFSRKSLGGARMGRQQGRGCEPGVLKHKGSWEIHAKKTQKRICACGSWPSHLPSRGPSFPSCNTGLLALTLPLGDSDFRLGAQQPYSRPSPSDHADGLLCQTLE